MQPENIFQIVVLVYSIILHEIAHGYAAYMFGDKTAFYQNRLTLNPIAHIDIVGSIIVPAFLILTQSSFLAGWAKPVPVAEHSLSPHKLGSFCVSFAGVFTNFLLTATFILIGSSVVNANIKYLCYIVAITNLSLAIFNLIPFPPADGFRIVSVFLSYRTKINIESVLQKYFLPIILVSIFFAMKVFGMIFPYFANVVGQLIF